LARWFAFESTDQCGRMAGTNVTPEDVIKFTKPTADFLCGLDANVYGIDFVSFVIKDYDTKRVIFKVDKDDATSSPAMSVPMDLAGGDFNADSLRTIDYNFDADVLSLPRLSTLLRFTVANNEVHKFRMIERHYFKNGLIKSFDFTFPFCMPNSSNAWESEYELPPLDSDILDDIVKNPFAVKSDSFYFVDGELIMHNKARYRYFYSKARESKLAGDDSEDEDAPSGNSTAQNASKLMSSDDEDEEDCSWEGSSKVSGRSRGK